MIAQHSDRARRRIPWDVAAYAVVAIAAQFFPLTADLHYEFSALTALAASLIAGLWVLSLPIRTESPLSTRIGTVTLRTIAASTVPLTISLVHTLFTHSCGILEGLAWYAVLVPTAAWISAMLGTLATELAAWLAPNRGWWLRSIFFLVLWSFSLFRGAHEAYHGPHIFMYAWQIGFFPGGSWDAELPITGTLLLYRFVHLVVTAALTLALIALERLRTERERSTGTGSSSDEGTEQRSGNYLPNPALTTGIAAVAILSCLCIIFRSDLGLTRTHGWLRAELGSELHTRYATIYYHAEGTDSLDLWRAANLTDFYVEEHAKALSLPLDSVEPITLYLFASAAEQKRYVGTASASFTKPWIRTLSQTFDRIEPTLRHELAHVMIEPYGNLLGISISQGLLEGSAMALENDYGERTLHQYAHMAYQFGLAPPVERIMSVGGFSSRRSSLSYVLAGSFSKWLIDRFGMQRYLIAFPWGDFQKGYGRDIHELSEEYGRFIDSLPNVDSTYLPTVRYLFGGGSFFFQRCLRRTGTLNARGYEALYRENYEAALTEFERSLTEGITYSARGGILLSLLGMHRYEAMLDSSRTYARDTASYPLLPFLIEQGDAHWALGEPRQARRLYDSAMQLDIGRTPSTRTALRLCFLDDTTAAMRDYFVRSMPVMQRLMILDRAYQTSTDTRHRLILALMRASLTTSSLPLSSIARLESDLSEARSDTSFSFRSFPPLERYIVASLTEHLRNGALYAKEISGGQTGSQLPELIATFTPTDASMNPEAEGYIQERRIEADRFRQYLHERPILP